MKDANRAKKQNTSEGKLKTSNRQLRAEITECKQIELSIYNNGKGEPIEKVLNHLYVIGY